MLVQSTVIRDWLRVGPIDGFYSHPLVAVLSIAVASELKLCDRDTEVLQKKSVFI